MIILRDKDLGIFVYVKSIKLGFVYVHCIYLLSLGTLLLKITEEYIENNILSYLVVHKYLSGSGSKFVLIRETKGLRKKFRCVIIIKRKNIVSA